MFGKWLKGLAGRKPASQAVRIDRVAPQFATDPSGVIVARSAFEAARSGKDPYQLVQAVIDYVNGMSEEGLYTRQEIVGPALQAYHADFYRAQVLNGGHSQFLHNCGADRAAILADVELGLARMGADHLVGTFAKFKEWISANPDEAATQTGFDGGRAPALTRLDDVFHAADRTRPMFELAARWIATWPELAVVADEDHSEVMRHAAAANPKRGERILRRLADRLTHQLTDDLQAGIGMACGAADEIKLQVGGGGHQEVDGEIRLTFEVRTEKGQRFCSFTEEAASLRACIEPEGSPMPDIGNVEGFQAALAQGRFSNYTGRKVGQELSTIAFETVEQFMQMAEAYRLGPAIVAALSAGGIESADVELTPLGLDVSEAEPVLRCFVVAGGAGYQAFGARTGLTLRPHDSETATAHVRREEIDAFVRRIAATI